MKPVVPLFHHVGDHVFDLFVVHESVACAIYDLEMRKEFGTLVTYEMVTTLHSLRILVSTPIPDEKAASPLRAVRAGRAIGITITAVGACSPPLVVAVNRARI